MQRHQGKRISLVLGSGGARGYAHIGVIRELQARGYQIEAISGCSIGALIGALYATGSLEAYAAWVEELDYIDIIRLVDFSWSGSGAIKGERLLARLQDFIPAGTLIQDLPIPFTAIATDLRAQKELWFQRGDLLQAVHASLAIPGVFVPVKYGDRYLVDGGVLNPVPIMPVVSAHADYIVAVNVTAHPVEQNLQDLMPDFFTQGGGEAPGSLQDWRQALANKAGGMLDRLAPWLRRAPTDDPVDSTDPADWSKMDMILQSFDITQAALAQYKLAGYPPDLLLEVPKNICGTHEFHRAKPMIELGRRLARDALDQWQQDVPLLR